MVICGFCSTNAQCLLNKLRNKSIVQDDNEIAPASVRLAIIQNRALTRGYYYHCGVRLIFKASRCAQRPHCYRIHSQSESIPCKHFLWQIYFLCAGPKAPKQVACGSDHSVVLTVGGQVRCNAGFSPVITVKQSSFKASVSYHWFI